MSQQPLKGYRGRPPSPELKLQMMRTYTGNQQAGVVMCPACGGTGQNLDDLYSRCKECDGNGRDSESEISNSGR
jgi:DnaJ-class molecular chaperone